MLNAPDLAMVVLRSEAARWLETGQGAEACHPHSLHLDGIGEIARQHGTLPHG